MARNNQKRKEYINKYRLVNKEKIKERSRKYNQKKKNDLQYTIQQKLIAYKGKARKRNYSFEILNQCAYYLFYQDCYYCGTEPNPLNGIDRVDNSKGYVYNNVVSCCKICNSMKNTLSISDFLIHINKIKTHQVL